MARNYLQSALSMGAAGGNPLMALAQIGIPMAQGFFAKRDQEKYGKKFGKEQARNNLIAALSQGRIRPENTVSPERGSGSKILGALGAGLQAYNQFNALGREEEQFNTNQETARLQQQAHEVGADEACSAGNQNLAHDVSPFSS